MQNYYSLPETIALLREYNKQPDPNVYEFRELGHIWLVATNFRIMHKENRDTHILNPGHYLMLSDYLHQHYAELHMTHKVCIDRAAFKLPIGSGIVWMKGGNLHVMRMCYRYSRLMLEKRNAEVDALVRKIQTAVSGHPVVPCSGASCEIVQPINHGVQV